MASERVSTMFDPTAWAQPTGVRFGNTGRNQFYGPGGWSLDLSMFRSIALGGTKRTRVPGRRREHPEPPGVRESRGKRDQRHVHADLEHSWRRSRQRWPEQRGLHGTADPAGRAVPVLNANDASAPLRIVRGGADAFCTVRRSPGESPRQAAFLHSSRHPRCCYGRPRVGPVAASGIASPRARHVSAHGAGWHLEGLQGCDRPAVRRRSDRHAGPCAARLGSVGAGPRELHAMPEPGSREPRMPVSRCARPATAGAARGRGGAFQAGVGREARLPAGARRSRRGVARGQ